MNKNKLNAAIKTFCLSLVEVLDEVTTHKTATKTYIARPKDVEFRRDVVAYADKHGTEKAATKFGLRKMQVAAYKAHRTMGTYR